MIVADTSVLINFLNGGIRHYHRTDPPFSRRLRGSRRFRQLDQVGGRNIQSLRDFAKTTLTDLFTKKGFYAELSNLTAQLQLTLVVRNSVVLKQSTKAK